MEEALSEKLDIFDFITDFQKLHRCSVQVAPATLCLGMVRSFHWLPRMSDFDLRVG